MEKIINKQYIFNTNLLARRIGNTFMVYNEESGETYELNDIAGEIYILLKDQMSIDNIFSYLCDEYNVSMNNIFDDVSELINRFENLNVIKFTD